MTFKSKTCNFFFPRWAVPFSSELCLMTGRRFIIWKIVAVFYRNIIAISFQTSFVLQRFYSISVGLLSSVIYYVKDASCPLSSFCSLWSGSLVLYFIIWKMLCLTYCLLLWSNLFVRKNVLWKNTWRSYLILSKKMLFT